MQNLSQSTLTDRSHQEYIQTLFSITLRNGVQSSRIDILLCKPRKYLEIFREWYDLEFSPMRIFRKIKVGQGTAENRYNGGLLRISESCLSPMDFWRAK